jgi:hypothetical protein
MGKMLTAVFDGDVLRPDSPVDLKPHTRYMLIVEKEIGGESATETPTAWEVLDGLTGTVEGPEDWAAEHDHYLYGSPKRGTPNP